MPNGLANGLGIAGLGLGLIGTVGKLFGAGKANRRLDALQASDPSYSANPLSQQRLGLAQTLLNARMPGSTQEQRNIYTSGANAMANTQKNATDSSQILGLGAAIQGQQGQQIAGLAEQDSANYQQRLQNLTGAQEGAIDEGHYVHSDDVRRFGDRAQIQGQKNQNNQNVWQSVASGGFALADFGLNGGFNNMFKKQNQTGIPAGMTY